jgi:hypothetical protein
MQFLLGKIYERMHQPDTIRRKKPGLNVSV